MDNKSKYEDKNGTGVLSSIIFTVVVIIGMVVLAHFIN